MDNDKLSRRAALQKSAAFGVLATLGGAACSKRPVPLACTDTAGLAPADLSVRTALAYVDYSMDPGKACAKCQQFTPSPAGHACGTCKVVKGPINPDGDCKSFVARPA